MARRERFLFSMEVEGLKELEQALLGLDDQVKKKNVARAALRDAAKPMAAKMAILAPDDPKTGAPDLSTSIKISKRQRSGTQKKDTPESAGWVNMYVGPTGKGYPQAIMQEFGTVHHGAQPYMRPAWDSAKPTIVDDIAKILAKKIKAAAKSAAKKRRNK